MNAKENALRVLRFAEPEWAPAGLPLHRLSYFGCNHEGYAGGHHDVPVGTQWRDIWGTTWHKEQAGVMAFPRGFPLADPSDLRAYRWPDPDDDRLCRQVYGQAAGWSPADQFLCGVHRDTLWEKSYMLVGMENMMCYFRTDPGYAREVLHRIMDFQLGMARHYLALGVEIVGLGDDLGTQRALLLSPRVIQEFLAPEYRRLFDLYKSHRVLIQFHSCGHIEPVLDLFMDLGVDVLNPLQATANDLERVRAQTQGRMALHGGISSGLVMSGPPEAIRHAVRHSLWQLGRHGGYFPGPDQGLPYPAEHLKALDDAVAEYGRYPLQSPA